MMKLWRSNSPQMWVAKSEQSQCLNSTCGDVQANLVDIYFQGPRPLFTHLTIPRVEANTRFCCPSDVLGSASSSILRSYVLLSRSNRDRGTSCPTRRHFLNARHAYWGVIVPRLYVPFVKTIWIECNSKLNLRLERYMGRVTTVSPRI